MYEAPVIDFKKLPEDASEEQKAKQLPRPTGWHMLAALPEIKKKTEGGIILTDDHRDREHTASIVCLILKQGPLCYADKKKFPGEPWCNEGDFVIIKAYSGIRMEIHGSEFRIITDDMVQAVVEDPRGIASIRRL